MVRGCRDLTRQAISPIRAEFIGEEPSAKVEYADILGCPIRFGAEWDALVYSEETTRLPAKGADDKLLRVLEEAGGARAGLQALDGRDAHAVPRRHRPLDAADVLAFTLS